MQNFLLSVCSILLFSNVTLHAECLSGNCQNGFGIYITTQGDKYIGHFDEGNFNGMGVLHFSNDDKYIGSWAQGNFNGFGTYTFENGYQKRGEWKAGEFVDSQESGCITGNCEDGYGVYVSENDERFVGSFLNNQPSGKGIYFLEDGSKFIGEMRTGKKHGEGILYLSNGSSISGIWRNDAFLGDAKSGIGCLDGNCNNGQGTFVYPDNSRYLGSFKHALAHGQGVCVYSNGDYYEGEWRNHNYNGFGTLILSDGTSYKGYWENGDYIGTHPRVVAKASPLKKPTVKALIVGVSKYTHMRSLRYTDDDAYRMYAFLRSPEGGAVKDENIKVLVDENATRDRILDSIDEMFGSADEDDIVMFYFSGHGLKGSFVPSDYDGTNGEIYHNEILSRLNRCNAKGKIVIADACHSGGMGAAENTTSFTMKSGIADGSMDNYYRAFHQSKGGTALLLSSKAEENSIEFNGLRQGIFSHYLLRGLKGEADMDSNNIVTIFELYQFIHTGVMDYTENIQTPILIGDFDRNLPLGIIRN